MIQIITRVSKDYGAEIWVTPENCDLNVPFFIDDLQFSLPVQKLPEYASFQKIRPGERFNYGMGGKSYEYTGDAIILRRGEEIEFAKEIDLDSLDPYEYAYYHFGQWVTDCVACFRQMEKTHGRKYTFLEDIRGSFF